MTAKWAAAKKTNNSISRSSQTEWNERTMKSSQHRWFLTSSRAFFLSHTHDEVETQLKSIKKHLTTHDTWSSYFRFTGMTKENSLRGGKENVWKNQRFLIDVVCKSISNLFSLTNRTFTQVFFSIQFVYRKEFYFWIRLSYPGRRKVFVLALWLEEMFLLSISIPLH